MTELLPCPFCGETQALAVSVSSSRGRSIECLICGTEGPCSKDRDVAAEGWNNRKAPVCDTCDGTGAVGYPPDDYSSCPECNSLVDQIEAEREACIRILEDMRPRNDRSDWNEFTVTTDTILRLAIEAINARYAS